MCLYHKCWKRFFFFWSCSFTWSFKAVFQPFPSGQGQALPLTSFTLVLSCLGFIKNWLWEHTISKHSSLQRTLLYKHIYIYTQIGKHSQVWITVWWFPLRCLRLKIAFSAFNRMLLFKICCNNGLLEYYR